jgi:hypothetical protein
MGWVVNATPLPLYPREWSGTHCIGGWVGPRFGLDGCGKYRFPPVLDPRTVQPVASRYTRFLDRWLTIQYRAFRFREEDVVSFICAMWFGERFCSTELAERIRITGHSKISTILLQLLYIVWFKHHLTFVTLVLLYFRWLPDRNVSPSALNYVSGKKDKHTERPSGNL